MIKYLFFLSTLSLSTVCQNNNPDVKLWSSIDTLTYNDFKKGKRKNKEHALSRTSLNYFLNEDCEFILEPVFLKSGSFFDDKYLGNYRLLKHEQLHFDILELIVRKFRKEIDEDLLGCSEETYLEKRLEFYLNNYRETAIKYDIETNHSINMKIQLEWEEHIRKELYKLKEYSTDKIIERP